MKDCIDSSIRVERRTNRRTVLTGCSATFDPYFPEAWGGHAGVERLLNGGSVSAGRTKVVVAYVQEVLAGAGNCLYVWLIDAKTIDQHLHSRRTLEISRPQNI